MADVNARRETARLAVIVGLGIFLAMGFLPWGMEMMNTNLGAGAGMFILAAAAIGVAVWLFLRERKKISAGLPVQDERSKLIFQKATSYSFYTTLYFLLMLAFLSGERPVRDTITVHGALMLALAEMVLALFVFLGYFHLKGVPE